MITTTCLCYSVVVVVLSMMKWVPKHMCFWMPPPTRAESCGQMKGRREREEEEVNGIIVRARLWFELMNETLYYAVQCLQIMWLHAFELNLHSNVDCRMLCRFWWRIIVSWNVWRQLRWFFLIFQKNFYQKLVDL